HCPARHSIHETAIIIYINERLESPSATNARLSQRCSQEIGADRADHRLAFVLGRDADTTTASRAIDRLDHPGRRIGSSYVHEDAARRAVRPLAVARHAPCVAAKCARRVKASAWRFDG